MDNVTNINDMFTRTNRYNRKKIDKKNKKDKLKNKLKKQIKEM